jgi:hypothetical protein
MTNPATMRSGKVDFRRDAYMTKGTQTLGITRVSKLSLPMGSEFSLLFGINIGISDEITYKFDPVLQDLLPDTTIALKSGDVDVRLMLGAKSHPLRGVTKLSSIPGIVEVRNLKEVTLIVKLTSVPMIFASANYNFSMTWTASLPDVIRGSLVVAPPQIVNFFGSSSGLYTPPLIIYSPSEVRGVLPCTRAGAGSAAWQYTCTLSGRMTSQLKTTTFRATVGQGGELYLQVQRILLRDTVRIDDSHCTNTIQVSSGEKIPLVTAAGSLAGTGESFLDPESVRLMTHTP